MESAVFFAIWYFIDLHHLPFTIKCLPLQRINKKIMKQIKNIVFDFGGVVIGLDREQAVKAFERIGVREADSLLGKYHQQGIFQEVENGNIDAETFRCELSKICGKELTYRDGLREIEYEDIKRANRLMYITAFLCELLSVAVMSLVLILI